MLINPRLADDLLDTYYSIVHIRFPFLDSDDFRARFSDPDTHPEGPLYHPLLAVALAWGARFSDHPVIIADREEITSRLTGASGAGMHGQPERSRLVQMMIIRAREVAEVNKAFRNAKVDNVRVAMLLESLLAREYSNLPIRPRRWDFEADPCRSTVSERKCVQRSDLTC